MKMRVVPAVVLIVILVAALAAPVAAQDNEPICNGLSAGDCETLVAAQKAMDGVTSFTTPEWTIYLEFMTPQGVVTFEANGSGGFEVDPVAMDPAEGLRMHMVIEDAMVVSPEMTQAGSLEFIIADGMIYVYDDGEWYGGPLENDAMMTPPGGLGDLGDLLELGTAGPFDVDLPGVLSTERDVDAEFDDQPVAVFITTVHLPQLARTLVAAPLTGMLADLLDETDLELDLPQPEELQLFGGLLAPLLATSSLTFEQWVGLEDGYIHQIALDVVFDVDLSDLDSQELQLDLEPLFVEFNFMSSLGAINEPLELDIPESYKPLEALGNGATLDA